MVQSLACGFRAYNLDMVTEYRYCSISRCRNSTNLKSETIEFQTWKTTVVLQQISKIRMAAEKLIALLIIRKHRFLAMAFVSYCSSTVEGMLACRGNVGT